MSTTPLRLVLVHGFTQTGATMRPLGDRIAGLLAASGVHGEVVTPDAPGHGDRAGHPLDLVRGAEDLAERGGPGTWVGYSLGARLSLHVALARPDLVERLVTIGGTPGIADDAERARRRAADDALADDVERMGVPAFVERWLAQPMFAGLPDDPATLAERRRNTAAGLAGSLRLAGTGTQTPLWDRLGELAMPVLLMAGARDEKFVEIGHRAAAAIPDATVVTVADAGHAAHLEQPDATAEAIAGWLLERRSAQAPSARPTPNSAP